MWPEPDIKACLLEDLENSEFYCSVYASKEQPHVEGLQVTLADGPPDVEAGYHRGT